MRPTPQQVAEALVEEMARSAAKAAYPRLDWCDLTEGAREMWINATSAVLAHLAHLARRGVDGWPSLDEAVRAAVERGSVRKMYEYYTERATVLLAARDAALAEARAEIERMRLERDEHKAAAEGALQGQQDALAAFDAEAGKRLDVIRALGVMRARAETAEKDLAESRRFHGLAQEEILRERNAANIARAAAEAAEKRLEAVMGLDADWIEEAIRAGEERAAEQGRAKGKPIWQSDIRAASVAEVLSLIRSCAGAPSGAEAPTGATTWPLNYPSPSIGRRWNGRAAMQWERDGAAKGTNTALAAFGLVAPSPPPPKALPSCGRCWIGVGLTWPSIPM